MNYEIAMLRAAVGYKVARPGLPFVTGGGQDEYGDDRGMFVNVGGVLEQYSPTAEDEAATDWAELA